MISRAFYPLLTECRGGGIFFPALLAVAACVESAIISIVPSECIVSPLWPDLAPTLSKKRPKHKGGNARALEGLFVKPVGVWFATGRKKEAFHGERGPVLLALIAKHKLQTEPEGIEEVRQPDQYAHFLANHVEYVWECSAMQHLFPSLFPTWMTLLCALATVPYPSKMAQFGRELQYETPTSHHLLYSSWSKYIDLDAWK